MSQPGDPALEQAKALHQSGDLRAATRLYRKILAREPDRADALNLFGILASQKGDHATAATRIERAIAIDGRVADFHTNLGVAHETAGDLTAAAKHYTDALVLEPANTQTLLRLEAVIRQTEDYGGFADTLTRLVAEMPEYANAHYLLGTALYVLHRIDEASNAFRRATELAPDFASGHSSLASTLMDLGDPEGALDASEACLARDPRHTYALAVKAMALSERGDRPGVTALQDYDRLLGVYSLEPPEGYADIEAFNAALETAVLEHPTLRLDPTHKSCHFSDQTDDLFLDPATPFAAFEAMIRDAAQAYQRRLDPNSPHPFLAEPAPSSVLVGWATVMRAQGHQSAHIHPTGWLSGVYYVTVPDLVQRGDNAHKGWIEFGRPPEHFKTTVEPDIHFIEPVAGALILFPSYFYHRTVPYDDDALRISIAFDFDTMLAE